jgi:hypothetical protein
MVREDGGAENTIPARRERQPALPVDSEGEADWEATSGDEEESSVEEEEDDVDEGEEVPRGRGEKRKAGSEDEREDEGKKMRAG